MPMPTAMCAQEMQAADALLEMVTNKSHALMMYRALTAFDYQATDLLRKSHCHKGLRLCSHPKTTTCHCVAA